MDINNAETDPAIYDLVIVGGGIAGALIANELSKKGQSILIIESGDATSHSQDGYQSYVDYFLGNPVKTPNSPYPDNPNSPSPEATSVVKVSEKPSYADGYFVQMGPQPFSSNYNRNLGGTTLHWMGTCYRMSPQDFKIKSLYKVGQDWPIGYDDLQDCYSNAEYEIGVSADVEEQQYLGIKFDEGYVYPMHSLPPSYFDKQMIREINGSKITFDDQDYEIRVIGIPAGRNSIPNKHYNYQGRSGYQPVGSTGNPNIGLRCEGNSSCTPICPVQAKYSALKTLEKTRKNGVRIISQNVASKILFDADHKKVEGIYCKQYSNDSSPLVTGKIYRGRKYIIAANAIENAKLMLASSAVDKSGELGCNLMDHPYLLTWGQTKKPIGSFRGPGYTCGVPTLSDGEFRKHRGAFRVDIGNWGWNFATFAPFSTVADLLGKNITGKALKQAVYDNCQRQARLGFMVEQLPSRDNRVQISEKFTDALGNYRPVIHYHVDDYTVAGFTAATQFTKQVFDTMEIEDKSQYLPSNAGYVNGFTYHGAGHVVGTHRMGTAIENSVVDSYQRSWQYHNLYLAGCGSMPTIGTTNPTLTCAALSIRTARHLTEQS